MMKMIAGCSALVTGAVAIGACYGSADADKQPEVAVTDRAALVSKKRKWLEGFDRHCDACFAAFDLCEQGAEADELDACRVAMDACVRGGLLGGDGGLGDAGEPLEPDAGLGGEQDAGELPAEEDAGSDSDGGLGEIDEDAAVDEDAGADGDPDDLDAGIGEEDAGEQVDADADVIDDDEGRAREVLLSEIGTCLDLTRSCLEPDDADFAQCVNGLQVCVQQALEEAFEVICSEQVRACRAENRSRESIERVERECRANLLI